MQQSQITHAQDHDLGQAPHTGAYVKRLLIYMTAVGDSPVSELRFHIQGYEEVDQGDNPGKSVNGASIDELIREFVEDTSHFSPPAEFVPTPLDFSIAKPCVVVLKLIGDFWEFSPTRPPVRTKDQHSDERYFGLKAHGSDRVKAISFAAKEPLPPNNGKFQRHGLNFYVDFLQHGKRLPVMIDPDVVNKGGNG